MALSPKAAKFVREYLVDMNASAAARRAGYSEKTAGFIGFENLKKPNIQAALEEERKRLSKATISPEEIIKILADLARFDLADCYDEKGELKNIHDIPKESRRAISMIERLETRTRGQYQILKKLRTLDPNGALEKLCRIYGMFNADKSQKPDVLFCMPIVAVKGKEG